MNPTRSARGQNWIEPRSAAITASVVAMILWGSLYPFSFYDRGTLLAGLRYLISTWPYAPDRGDLMSNVLLYAPLGFFAVRSLRRLPFAACVAMVTLFGALLSAGIEFTQFWDVGRAPAVSDLYSNAIGALFGGMLAGTNPRAWKFPLLGKMTWRPYALLLMVFWLGNRMFPYIPSLDLRAYRIAWGTLLHPSALDLYRQTVNWLAVALLLEALFGIARTARSLAVVAGLAVLGRLLIGVAVPVEEVSALLAIALWMGIFSRLRIRAAIVAALFTVSVALQALEPFHFLSQPGHFGWIPFVSFIDGPRENGVRVFFDKAFSYGAIVWLMARAGLSWAVALAVSTALVFSLRFAQIYLPGRSAEITDAAMVLMLACILRMMRDVPRAD